MAKFELIKGLGFVFVTGLLLFIGSRALLQHIREQCQQIERQRAALLEVDRRSANGLLANAIGHDANNLLTAVSMAVELLKRGVEPKRQQELVTKVETVVEELIVLNNRLVTGGQADQNSERQERSLQHEAERVLQFIDRDHPINQLELTFTTEGDVNAPINRHLFMQLMFNLLTNCQRHAGKEARVNVHTQDCGDKVCVIVEDDGPGVPKEERDHIFEAYYSKHPEGSGLGLASVRSIMLLHEGDVVCQSSEEYGGAKFKMHFPRKPAAAAPSKGQADQTDVNFSKQAATFSR